MAGAANFSNDQLGETSVTDETEQFEQLPELNSALSITAAKDSCKRSVTFSENLVTVVPDTAQMPRSSDAGAFLATGVHESKAKARWHWALQRIRSIKEYWKLNPPWWILNKQRKQDKLEAKRRN